MDRFAANQGELVRHCVGDERWYLWDGRRWCPDLTRRVEPLARETLERVAGEMEDAAARAAGKERVALLQRAKAIRSPKYAQITLNGAVGTGVAPCGDRLGIATQELDDPVRTARLLNCANGVLDLETFELIPHEQTKTLLITRLCDVKYIKESQCPEFCSALERIFEADRDPQHGAQLIALFQQSLGYSLSGEQTVHAIFVLLGKGGHNGKSFLMKVIQDVLGNDYVATLHRSVLLRARGEQHPTGLMELRGRRMVIASEFADRQEFDGALLKSISGNDQISGRHMRENFQTFAPTHHLWIASNHLPAVDRTDVALWNRFIIIPFERTFVRCEDPEYLKVPAIVREDPELTARVLAKEREGIFAWMVAGLRAFRRRGRIELPEASLRLRGALQGRRDSIEHWLDDRCSVQHGERGERLDACADWFTNNVDLRESYEGWCHANGREAVTPKSFGLRLERLGFAQLKKRGDRGRVGLRLRGGER